MGLVTHYVRRKANKTVLGARLGSIYCKPVPAFGFVFFSLVVRKGNSSPLQKSDLLMRAHRKSFTFIAEDQSYAKHVTFAGLEA